ncbi:MAG TPA: DNA-binding protein [Clostridiales bacterium]|mgnify:CR=1 FL=1|jgi:hypothetical protein|nr:DNA-binding protein [Clostridiales bacterium]
MKKDLTTSKIHRMNILNNEMAVIEVKKQSNFDAVMFEGEFLFTKEMLADFFEIDVRTVERYTSKHLEELEESGYKILRGKVLKDFLQAYHSHFGTDINVGTKTTVLGVFEFKAFLNMAMLLSESENAKILRQAMLDIVIDLINEKTGGSTKYINQRDVNFIGSFLQGENYRREFTDALKNYVDMGNIKYPLFTDMIYRSIFKENAKEYRQILNLKSKDSTRETFYSEILNLVAAYECGLAENLRAESEAKGRPLNNWEAQEIFKKFESLPHWKPLIINARNVMASRDLALRDAFHKQLEQYLTPLSSTEYERFLGDSGKTIEQLMEENKDILKRLKERE